MSENQKRVEASAQETFRTSVHFPFAAYGRAMYSTGVGAGFRHTAMFIGPLFAAGWLGGMFVMVVMTSDVFKALPLALTIPVSTVLGIFPVLARRGLIRLVARLVARSL